LLILIVLPAMMLMACNSQPSQSPAPLVPSDAEQAAAQAQASAAEMRQTVNRLVADNQMLTREMHDLQRRIMDQATMLSELSQQASRLEGAALSRASAGDGTGAASAVRPGSQASTATSGFGSFVLYLLIFIVAIIVIYFIYRALKPRPFEDDEDDDFSSFDDDFGFEDEDEDEDADKGGKKKDDDDK
jgi:hypothetical protein